MELPVTATYYVKVGEVPDEHNINLNTSAEVFTLAVDL